MAILVIKESNGITGVDMSYITHVHVYDNNSIHFYRRDKCLFYLHPGIKLDEDDKMKMIKYLMAMISLPSNVYVTLDVKDMMITTETKDIRLKDWPR
jgi:TRAP-type uncharacterized transport system fused permease subunit